MSSREFGSWAVCLCVALVLSVLGKQDQAVTVFTAAVVIVALARGSKS